MNLDKVLKRPVITEKSTKGVSGGVFSFEVSLSASKGEIARAVEGKFGVDVVDVRASVIPGKIKRVPGKRAYYKTSRWKKALVRLKTGQKIKLFEVGEGK